MEARPILKNKFYLYLTEFFSGVSVMAVELGASRLLAPYFSSSQIVWTIVIGTIMIAMALGNLWGGRTADKDPNPDRLYRRILIAAVWIAAIPFLGKYVILGISGVLILTVNTNLLILASFLSCMLVFVFPLFLLGTVTPSLVKCTVDSLDDSGKTVGMLGASNTIGSILGTFLPTFVTIPAVGTSVTFLIFSGILLVLGLIYFFSCRVKKLLCMITVFLYVLCAVFGHSASFAFWEKNLTYEGESIYNYLQVKEDDHRVILSTNVLFGVQSVKMKEDGFTGMYYDYALAAPVMVNAMEKNNARILVLGNGTGTYASQCANYFSTAQLEGVEIDQKITNLAEEYFSLPSQQQVFTYDGRAYLQTVDKKYDVILVDAYQDITIPFQMSSMEFFKLVQEHLTETGILCVNMNLRSGDEDGINTYLTDTISAVFGQVYTADVTSNTNRILFAGHGINPATALEKNLYALKDDALRQQMMEVSKCLVPYEAGNHILTDDKAPVEMLGMNALNELIDDELEYYKDVFRKKGLRGLFDAI